MPSHPSKDFHRPPLNDLTRIVGVTSDIPIMRPLRELGVRMMGMDKRPPRQSWGETSLYLIFIVAAGRIYYPRDKAPPILVKRGEALLLPENSPKRVETHRCSATVLWIHLLPDGTLRKNLALPQQVEVHPFPHSELLRVATEVLIREPLQQHPDSGEACAALCNAIFHFLRRHLGAHESFFDRNFRKKMACVLDNIAAQPEQPWSVPMLAHTLNMSVGHLHRTVRRLYGQPPACLIRSVRMAKAAELLRTSHEKLDTIAVLVGYSNAYNFSQAFLRQTGWRPGLYRKSIHR